MFENSLKFMDPISPTVCTVWKLLNFHSISKHFYTVGIFIFYFSRLYNLSSNKVGFGELYAPASKVPFYMYWLWCLIITKQIVIQLNGVDISLNCL